MTVYQARFFHDWGASWLWASNDQTRLTWGYDIDHHAIGLSPELEAELDRLATWHDSSLGRSDPDASTWQPEECDAFNADVRSAFSWLAVELAGSWNVVNEFAELQCR